MRCSRAARTASSARSMARPEEAHGAVLAGWRVWVTRPQPEGDALAARLQALGASVLQAPQVRIEPLPVRAADDALIAQLDCIDIVVVTSRNAVRHGLPRLAARWPRWPLRPVWLAVGRGTAGALSAFGIEAVVPDDERSEGLLALPALAHPEGRRVLLLTGEGGRGLIPEALRARGAAIGRLDVYRRIEDPAATGVPATESPCSETSPRAVLVTSAGAMHNLLARSPGLAGDGTWWLVPVERIAQAARDAGVRSIRVCGGADDDSMVAAMCSLARCRPEEGKS